jgi:sialate O-acetylesterase
MSVRTTAALTVALLLACTAHAADDLKLPALFSDHMVLQRDVPVPVWGTATPGTKITVAWRSHEASATTDKQGKWHAELPATPAGGPFDLTVISGDNVRRIRDVLVGEVWLCSGQSNMAWPVNASANYDTEKQHAKQNQIRMFTTPHAFKARPLSDVDSKWVVTSPETVGRFSAVGFFFGRELHKELKVPIGLLHSSVGGTRIEPWIPRRGFRRHPDFAHLIQEMDAAAAEFESKTPAQLEAEAMQAQVDYEKALRDYWNTNNDRDPGITGDWSAPNLDDSQWKILPPCNTWERSGIAALEDFDGSVWVRTTVRIPRTWAGKPVTLQFPAIDDTDTTYYDGTQVGRTTYKWTAPRSYEVPANLVEYGEAVIAVQMIDYRGAGGFVGEPAQQQQRAALLCDGADPPRIPLDQPWRFKIAATIKDLPMPPELPRPRQHPAESWTSPTALYNGMIAPLVPYGLRGAIWYQGESNASEPEAYRKLLPLLVDSWRVAWQQTPAEFPFGVVQLANFLAAHPEEPAPGGWAWLRDAQLHAITARANVGLAVTIDIGDAADIHPRNKQEVGRRLALWALAQVYGEGVPFSGPIYDQHEVTDGRVVLRFQHSADGLRTSDGKPPAAFAIAGKDRVFHHAQAHLERDRVIVWSDEVPDPVAVRYAWATNPARANLVNAAGLPASPFRTDDWPPEKDD